MIKRYINLLLIFMLCMLIITGCSNNQTTNDDIQSDTNNSQNITPSSEDVDISKSSSGSESPSSESSVDSVSGSESSTENPIDSGNSSGISSGTATNTDGSSSDANSTSDTTFTASVSSINVEFDEDDYYNNDITSNATTITLNKINATINGSGATADGSIISITAAGVYVISGSLSDGQIIVNAGDKDDVQLVLNGVTLHSSNRVPIYVQNADKVVLSLPKGTKNVLSDTNNIIFTNSENNEPNATIFSKSDLVINGLGTLSIDANFNNAIVSKDDLKITDATIAVNSVDDGILGRDSIAVKNATITVEAGGDGLKATNEEDSSKGYVLLDKGTYNITAGSDGIQSVTTTKLIDAKITMQTGGGSSNNLTDSNSSAKGIKSANTIIISGGKITINSSDDAIHSNNLISIEDGTIDIAAGDDGIHADAEIKLLGGTVNITKSYEGIESSLITIDGGKYLVTASDDGINVAGGADGSSMDGRMGQNNFATTVSSNTKLTVNDGYLYINANGDGLDSNGNIYINGGTILVNGPTNDGNGPLDYQGSCEITGGYLIAAGSSGMAQAPGDQSSQYSIGILFTQSQAAGTLVHIEDSSGKTIATFAPAKQFTSMVVSTSSFNKGETYNVYTGGSSTGKGENGDYSDGTYKKGTQMVEFQISDVVTWVNESGITEFTGGFGGRGGFGGGMDGNRPNGGFGRGKKGN